MKSSPYDGLIFDMDGVLVDVRDSYREAIRLTGEYFLKRRVTPSEIDEIKNKTGMNNDWDATYALVGKSHINYSEVKNYFQKIYLGNENKTGLIDLEPLFISPEILTKLKSKYKLLGIATGRPRMEAEYTLNKNKIRKLFDCVIGMEDAEKGKPAPDPIIAVIKKLGLKNTVYIGDGPSDVVAAKAAGIPSVYIGKLTIGDYRFPDVLSFIKFIL